MRIACDVKKWVAVCLLLCGFMVFAHAGETTLTLKNGKAAAKKVFLPRKKTDALFYLVKLRKGQSVEIKVVSNEIYLSEENACGMYFELFDGGGKQLFLGDSPAGIDAWEGEIEETGSYKIKVFMSCLEAFTTDEVRRKKPSFNYTLAVDVK
jgi:hypothetical protein